MLQQRWLEEAYTGPSCISLQQRPCKFITGPRLFDLTLRLLGVGQVFTVHGTNKLRFHGPRYQQPRTVNKRSAFKSTVSMSKPLAPGAKAASTTSVRVLNLALGGWQSRTLGGEILALQKRIFIRLLICSSVNGTACLHKCPGLVDQSPHLQVYGCLWSIIWRSCVQPDGDASGDGGGETSQIHLCQVVI